MEGKGSGRAVKSQGRGARRFHTSLPKRTLSRSPAKETTATEALAEDSGPATAKAPSARLRAAAPEGPSERL